MPGRCRNLPRELRQICGRHIVAAIAAGAGHLAYPAGYGLEPRPLHPLRHNSIPFRQSRATVLSQIPSRHKAALSHQGRPVSGPRAETRTDAHGQAARQRACWRAATLLAQYRPGSPSSPEPGLPFPPAVPGRASIPIDWQMPTPRPTGHALVIAEERRRCGIYPGPTRGNRRSSPAIPAADLTSAMDGRAPQERPSASRGTILPACRTGWAREGGHGGAGGGLVPIPYLEGFFGGA
jgi:hypothetical protein